MNPWPTNPPAIRAASLIGARPLPRPSRPSAFERLAVWLLSLVLDLACWGAVLFFLLIFLMGR